MHLYILHWTCFSLLSPSPMGDLKVTKGLRIRTRLQRNFHYSYHSLIHWSLGKIQIILKELHLHNIYHNIINRIWDRDGGLEGFHQGHCVRNLLFWSKCLDFLFLSLSLLGGIPVDCTSHLLQARRILNWTTWGTRHKASLPSHQRKEDINRVQHLFVCWPAAHFPPLWCSCEHPGGLSIVDVWSFHQLWSSVSVPETISKHQHAVPV
jgi:hypothetical protein